MADFEGHLELHLRSGDTFTLSPVHEAEVKGNTLWVRMSKGRVVIVPLYNLDYAAGAEDGEKVPELDNAKPKKTVAKRT